MIEFWKAGKHGTKLDSTGWVDLVYAINPPSLHSLKLHACSSPLLHLGSQMAWHSSITMFRMVKNKQNCPLQIGKCSMRKQLMEHQTHMGVIISNLQHSFVWVCYTALSPVQKTLLLTQCELNGCHM